MRAVVAMLVLGVTGSLKRYCWPLSLCVRVYRGPLKDCMLYLLRASCYVRGRLLSYVRATKHPNSCTAGADRLCLCPTGKGVYSYELNECAMRST